MALTVLLSLGYYSYLNNEDFVRTSKMVSHTNEVLYHVEQSQSVAFELESLLLKYVISGDSSFLKLYTKELQSGSQHVKKLQELTKDNPIQQQSLDSLRKLGREKVEYNTRVIKARAQSYSQAQQLIPSDQNGAIQNKLIFILEEMNRYENTLLGGRLEQNREGQVRFYAAFSSLLVVIVLILMLVFFAINRNLNARIVAEEKTKQLNTELEAFTYSVSHDLRAPLRSVDGYAKILHEDYGDKLDAEGHRVLKVIMNNAKRMGHLIDDLLEFSRLGRKEPSSSHLNMKEIVEWVVKDQLENYKTTIPEITIGDLQNCTGDHSMIRQVWINLISNAIKYSSKSAKPHIVIQSRVEADQTIYSVSDNGVGFDMSYAHKLFGVFQRLHKASDFEGTGVGLALVQRIINKHQGKVWAEAELNKGATFYFSIGTKHY